MDVAGSNPVVRSQSLLKPVEFDRLAYAYAVVTVGWPRGEAAACKAVYAGSNPVPTSTVLALVLHSPLGAIGAAVARFPDTEEVTGSIPVSRTTVQP